MLDLSVVQKSLQDARSGRIGEYFFYIQDTVVFNPSHFYWYPNQAQFFEAIQSDLLGFLFKDPSDPGIEVLRADLTLLISDQISLDDYPNVNRWYQELMARPAVQRGFAVPLR